MRWSGGNNLQRGDDRLEIHAGSTGYSYYSLFGHYLRGAQTISLTEPWLQQDYQFDNLFQFGHLLGQMGKDPEITLTTRENSNNEGLEYVAKLLSRRNVELKVRYVEGMRKHDRHIKIDDRFTIDVGYGLHLFERYDEFDPFNLAIMEQTLRTTKETVINYRITNENI